LLANFLLTGERLMCKPVFVTNGITLARRRLPKVTASQVIGSSIRLHALLLRQLPTRMHGCLGANNFSSRIMSFCGSTTPREESNSIPFAYYLIYL
jgi:hypothetical protein